MKTIPVNEPLLAGNEKKYVLECIDGGWISSGGSFVKKFEEKFAEKTGRKHAITVSNGSVAIDVVTAAIGITSGDEVIMPSFTIISCAAPIVRAGALPVFVDSDPTSWNMDITQIEAKITKRTKAIMVVHIYGLPVDMDPILSLAEQYSLTVIEDAAEAHGQTYKRKPCGSFGNISTFSFYANKHITTGEGGMITTDDDSLADRCRSLRNLCFKPEKRFVHDELGWNFRLSNLQAALGLAQLEKLNEATNRKREMGMEYTRLLSGIGCLQLPLTKTIYAENIYWVFGVVLKEKTPFDAIDAMIRLRNRGIETRPFFFPLHKQPVFLKMGLFKDLELPTAEYLSRRGFYIPSGLALTIDQIKYVASAMRAVFTSY